MTTTRLVSLLAAAAVAGTTLVGAPATAAPAGTTSLSSTLSEDGNRFDTEWGDFDVAEKAVRAVVYARPESPVGVLADGETALTAFIPTDRAFRRYVAAQTGQRPRTERGVFRTLKQLADVETLESVLLYHVVPGRTLTYTRVRRADGAVLTTAQGGEVTVQVSAGTVRLTDLDPDAANARIVPTLSNLNRGNKQIAHGVSRVLRPTDL